MKYQIENFELHIEENAEAMSEVCAAIIAEQINKKADSVMGFATGGTPEGTYRRLIELNQANKVDFSRITTFNLDEYYPIRKSNSQSYDSFMKDKLFNHVNVNHDKLHIPNGEAADPLQECRDYEEQIKQAGGIDFQILGIGLNGHIGFNEPDKEGFAAKTQFVDLQESTIQANARFFDNIEEVPKKAISMGIKTIMMAKKILLMANGEGKAAIINQMIFGKITPLVPASALQLHRDVVVVVDKAAAKELKL